ncbi:MAG: transmembrane 220 family protein [Bdellovibrionales bacterium]|nr:transmembrane 220 family protein [Bdellovibrionales bacterium]
MVAFINGLFFLLFFAALVLNHNDPDPQVWMPLYGTAALFCVLYYKRKRVPIWLGGLFAIGCAVGSVYHALEVDTSRSLFGQEYFNESAGLLLCALWVGTLVRKTLKARQFMFITS